MPKVTMEEMNQKIGSLRGDIQASESMIQRLQQYPDDKQSVKDIGKLKKQKKNAEKHIKDCEKTMKSIKGSKG